MSRVLQALPDICIYVGSTLVGGALIANGVLEVRQSKRKKTAARAMLSVGLGVCASGIMCASALSIVEILGKK